MASLRDSGAQTVFFAHDHSAHAWDPLAEVIQGLDPEFVCQEMPIATPIREMRAYESSCAAKPGPNCAKAIADAVADGVEAEPTRRLQEGRTRAVKALTGRKPVFMNFADPAVRDVGRCLAHKGVKLVAMGGAHVWGKPLQGDGHIQDLCLGLQYPVAAQYAHLPARNLRDMFGAIERAQASEPVVLVIPGVNWAAAEATLQSQGVRLAQPVRETCHEYFAGRGHLVIEIEGNTLVIDRRLVPDVERFLGLHAAAVPAGRLHADGEL